MHRIYREAGLALRRKKRKHCVRLSTPLGVYTAANREWALDFVHDAVASGRSIRVLNVIDPYTREGLAMEVDTSFAGLRVTRVLDQIITERGVPRAIRVTTARIRSQGTAQVACPHRRSNALHRTRLSLGERLLRELPLQAARRVPQRRDLILAESSADPG